MKIKKRRKSSRFRASQTAKRGKKKKTRGSGNQGGVGMAGTGKRGDQKKTLVINMTGGNNYFGKSKTLRRGRVAKKLNVINLSEVSKFKIDKDGVTDLTGYKILSEGEIESKLKIKANAVSKSALSKIKESGSEFILIESDDKKDKKEERPKKVAKVSK